MRRLFARALVAFALIFWALVANANTSTPEFAPDQHSPRSGELSAKSGAASSRANHPFPSIHLAEVSVLAGADSAFSIFVPLNAAGSQP
ncbi:MAG: hypothetical protein SF172_04170 [Burkholderiales bacterium]|nr:hypothetical protein [Burkholderiales bacterium]